MSSRVLVAKYDAMAAESAVRLGPPPGLFYWVGGGRGRDIDRSEPRSVAREHAGKWSRAPSAEAAIGGTGEEHRTGEHRARRPRLVAPEISTKRGCLGRWHGERVSEAGREVDVVEGVARRPGPLRLDYMGGRGEGPSGFLPFVARDCAGLLCVVMP